MTQQSEFDVHCINRVYSYQLPYIWMEKCQFSCGSYSFITWLNPQGSCLKIKWTKFDVS